MVKKDTHNISKDYEKSVAKSHSIESNIVVNGKKIKTKETKRGLRINSRPLLGALIVLIIMGLAAGILYWLNLKESNNKDVVVSEVVTPEDVYNTTGNRIKESLNTEDTARKLENYEDLASIALAANKLDEALEYAQKAEAIGKSHTHAYVLGRIYEKKGDNQKAIAYYELAMSRATPPTFEGENSPYTDYSLAKEALVN